MDPPGAPNGSGNGLPPWLKDANEIVGELWADFNGFAGDMPAKGTAAYTERRRAFTMGAGMMRRRAMVLVLQIIAKRRPLDPEEAKLMDRILARMVRHKRGRNSRWTKAEDRKVVALIKRRVEAGPPKPYTKNGEVRRLAKKLGRSYMAVHRRMARLRGNCSNAESPTRH